MVIPEGSLNAPVSAYSWLTTAGWRTAYCFAALNRTSNIMDTIAKLIVFVAYDRWLEDCMLLHYSKQDKQHHGHIYRINCILGLRPLVGGLHTASLL